MENLDPYNLDLLGDAIERKFRVPIFVADNYVYRLCGQKCLRNDLTVHSRQTGTSLGVKESLSE